MGRSRRGASLLEVLVAITVLSIGVLGLIGTSALATRMLGQGRRATVTAGYAASRIETLRAGARDSTGCAGLTGGTASRPGGLTEDWSVVAAPRAVTVEVILSGGARTDTLASTIPCP